MNLQEIEQLVIRTVISSIDDETLDASLINPSTVLLGENAFIDSLTLVNVIVDIEEEISETAGAEISLTDDQAVFAEPSPYASISNLSNYILQLLT